MYLWWVLWRSASISWFRFKCSPNTYAVQVTSYELVAMIGVSTPGVDFLMSPPLFSKDLTHILRVLWWLRYVRRRYPRRPYFVMCHPNTCRKSGVIWRRRDDKRSVGFLSSCFVSSGDFCSKLGVIKGRNVVWGRQAKRHNKESRGNVW